ncbi:MAG: DUF2069 domain-containing protein [Thiobacillus sp.]|nr:DUF2069 domain-containing protein [Thiobacillus sp.]
MKALQAVSSASLILLIFVSLAWELWLAPIRPGGSWLVLKTLPLLLPLMGILKGRRYTYQWAPMLILVYFTEGVVRAWSDTGLSAWLAGVEVVLSGVFFFASIYYARLSAPSRMAR